MKRSCPFAPLPRRAHPQLQIAIPEHAQVKRKCNFEQPAAKRLCLHVKQECLKRKSDAEHEITKRQRLEEAESRTNMLVDAYHRIDHLEQIIRHLQIELEFYRQKTSSSNYNTQVLAY